MNGKQLLCVVLVLTVSVPALAVADQYLYVDNDLEAENVMAVQQHTVYFEMITQETRREQQLHQFAAVVVLVKRCIKVDVRNQFDNAVLWFNDQFLFGTKNRSDTAINITDGPVLGVQTDSDEQQTQQYTDANGKTVTYDPIREDELDDQGNPTWDTDDSRNYTRRYGAPANDGSAGAPARWVGCFIPDGFLMGMGSDDPYATAANSATDVVKEELMDLDSNENCFGCVFNYTGSFYITDPNGFNWIIDKFVYPTVLAAAEGLAPGDQVPDCLENAHASLLLDDSTGDYGVSTACGADAEQHRDRAEDDGVNGQPADDRDNHCYDSPNQECGAGHDDPTDTPRRNSTKVTTLEPIYIVHLQVDMFKEGIRDEAAWAWRSGQVRSGAPRFEDSPNTAPGDRAGGFCPTDNTDVRCSIEYNALLVVDFEAFDDVALPLQSEGTNEDEIGRNAKLHGSGAADDGDESKQGNSHRHNGGDANGDGTADDLGPDGQVSGGPAHKHDVLYLDLFFVECDSRAEAMDGTSCGNKIPYFYANPDNTYWRDDVDGNITTARPPQANDTCTGMALADTHPQGSLPFLNRVFIVCDTTGGTAEFHQHDGSQTIG